MPRDLATDQERDYKFLEKADCLSAEVSNFQAPERRLRDRLRKYHTLYADDLEDGRLLEVAVTNVLLLSDPTATGARDIRDSMLFSIDESCSKTVQKFLTQLDASVSGFLRGFSSCLRLVAVGSF